MKKFLSMTLALCMLLSLLPTAQLTAMAYEETDPTQYAETLPQAKEVVLTEETAPQTEFSALTAETELKTESTGHEEALKNKSASTRKSDTDVAYPVESGNIYFNKETGTITDCDESVTSADIPAEIDGVAVTSIGSMAFDDCESLASVSIPDTVTGIGWSAFADCINLTSITIPDSVTEIGSHAFYRCTNLTSATIGNNVTSIKQQMFEECTSLTSVIIGDSVSSIGSYTFFNCSALADITLTDSVTSIGYGSFKGCSSLTSAIIPSSVTDIGDEAFYDCVSLMNLTIPNGLTSIGEATFRNCKSLTSVEIPDSVTSIGKWAFGECDSLVNAIIGNCVTSIEGYAFYGCKNLLNVTLGSSVTNIDESSVFFKCNNLEGIWVDEKNANYSSDSHGILFNKDKTELIKAPNAISGEYKVPNNVTNIGKGAFEYCDSLTNVTIPDSVTSIDSYAFFDCISLTSVCFLGDAPEIGYGVFKWGDWLGSDSKVMLFYIKGKSGWNGYPTATWDGVNIPHVHNYVDGVCTECGDNQYVTYAVEGGNIYFDKETGTITGCDESVISADIPTEIDDVYVTIIG